MPKVDLEIVGKFFVGLDAISVEFPRVIVISSITLNNEKTSYALHFFRGTLKRFASKTLQHFFAFNIFDFKQPMFSF